MTYNCCNCRLEKNPSENHKYRRTIRNNEKLQCWNNRNSSVQMSAVLTPDNCIDSPKSDCSCDYEIQPDHVLKTNSKIKWGSNKPNTTSKYHSKCLNKNPKPKIKSTKLKKNVVPTTSCNCKTRDCDKIFKNECYCSFPPNKPFLPVKPEITSPRNSKNRNKIRAKSPLLKTASSRALETLRKAKGLLDYSPESEFLKRLRSEAKKYYDCECNSCRLKEQTGSFKYTDRRLLLEQAYKLLEMPRCQRDCDARSCKFANCDKIHAVRHIRDENYFDTHSTVNLTSCGTAEHKCIHKFTVDDRLLPQPLNADVYGVSRCTVCNKAMENNLNESIESKISPKDSLKSNHLDNIPEKQTNTQLQKQLHTQPQRQMSAVQKIQSVITPRKINIGTKNELIELKMPATINSEQQKPVKLCKSIAPNNTWALRYQKGVI